MFARRKKFNNGAERGKTVWRKKRRNLTIKGCKKKKNEDKSSNQEKVSNKPNTSNRNSQELATATQFEKKKDDDIGAKKSIPQNKRFVLGREKLDSA